MNTRVREKMLGSKSALTYRLRKFYNEPIKSSLTFTESKELIKNHARLFHLSDKILLMFNVYTGEIFQLDLKNVEGRRMFCPVSVSKVVLFGGFLFTRKLAECYMCDFELNWYRKTKDMAVPRENA
jgi:hypothetical protein